MIFHKLLSIIDYFYPIITRHGPMCIKCSAFVWPKCRYFPT